MEEDHEENLKCKVKELDRCKVREILIQTKKVRCFMNQDTALYTLGLAPSTICCVESVEQHGGHSEQERHGTKGHGWQTRPRTRENIHA